MALEAVFRRAQVDVTTHGFRSSFRDWAGDSTAFPRDSSKPPWRMPSRTRPRPPTAAVTPWRSGVRSWRLGPLTAIWTKKPAARSHPYGGRAEDPRAGLIIGACVRQDCARLRYAAARERQFARDRLDPVVAAPRKAFRPNEKHPHHSNPIQAASLFVVAGSDFGHGIAADNSPEISTTGRSKGRTGLGMAIIDRPATSLDCGERIATPTTR
jgi:hypothetical protein